MSINGTISVAVEFRDTATVNSVERVKTISLREATEYATGKVAIVTGTAGTAVVTLNEYGITPYRDSSGTFVELSSIQRVAFLWSGSDGREITDGLTSPSAIRLQSSNGRISVTDFLAGSIQPDISAGTGTGTYTIILYGS